MRDLVVFLFGVRASLSECVRMFGIHVCAKDGLVETATPQVVGDDHVGDGIEHKLYIVCVGGARHMAIDFFRRRLVLGLKLRLDVGSCLAILLSAYNFIKLNTNVMVNKVAVV